MNTTEQAELSAQITKRIGDEINLSHKSKTEIAEALGISKSTVSQYLSGRSLPSLATLAKLCAVLDCSADDILIGRK